MYTSIPSFLKISFPFRSPQSTEFSELYSRFLLVTYLLYTVSTVYICLSQSHNSFRKMVQMNLFAKQKKETRRTNKQIYGYQMGKGKGWDELGDKDF